MKLNQKNLKKLISNKKVIRGLNYKDLTLDSINNICSLCVNEVKDTIVSHSAKEWDETWKSSRVLNEKEAIKNYKPIPRLDRVIESVKETLHRSHPITVSLTRNVGPEYVFCQNKKEGREYADWVHIPYPYRFTKNKYYYKTFFHELSHAACARNRLCLKFKMKDEEEVAVDTSALIICILHGINVWEDSLSYSQNRAYGSRKKKQDHILFIKTAKQWRGIENKTKRIVKYFLSGREKPTSLFVQ